MTKIETDETKEILTINRETRGSERKEKERIPLRQQTLEQTIDKDPDFVYYLNNEIPEDIERHKMSGWTIDYKQSSDSRESESHKDGVNRVTVNRDPLAPVKSAVWLKKRKDWYDADKAAEQLEQEKKIAQLDPNHPLYTKKGNDKNSKADYGSVSMVDYRNNSRNTR